MRKNLLNVIKTNQLLKRYQTANFIKRYYRFRHIPKYIQQFSTSCPLTTSRYNSFCLIQGTKKRTLKVFAFNRHIVRSNTLKHNFKSLRAVT